MPITEEIVDAFVRCETKAHLKLDAVPRIPSELSRWQKRLKEDYRKECNELLRSAFQSYPGTPDLPSLKSCCHALILGYVVALPEIDAQIDALVLRRQIGARMDCPYIPIRFVRSESISMFDKLLLAFDAVAFSKAYGKMPRLGRIIHGRDHRTAAVPLSRLVRRINSVLKALTEQRARNFSPPLALNKHCVECEFQSRCREIAVAKDDLSLLPTLSSKERKKQNDKGIFTVLQLSYTFRSPRRLSHSLAKHYRWSSGSPSGLAALVWRLQWEASREAGVKKSLIVYNPEDCEAADRVATALVAMCSPNSGSESSYSTVNADALTREFPRQFGNVDFVLPEFRKINDAAYWDYQRSKVYVRSNSRLRRQEHNAANRQSISKVPVNKLVMMNEERPSACLRCASSLIYRIGRTNQTVYDLRFSPVGVKRWVVKYSHRRFICWKCKTTFRMHERKLKYRAGFCSYLIYQIIELQISQNAVAKNVNELFKLPLLRGSINRLKASEATRLEPAYQSILERIIRGKLVHADETKVTIAGNDGYVWVFTNLEDVAFVYSESRDAITPQSILANFSGVLISDFYAAYDSIPCTQQKCLVHLMRDLNDDLSKQPFNEEMKVLAQNFANLLKPMIETVDRFGLKAYYLRRHKDSVNRFYEGLARRDYQTDVAISYKRRFERNSGKLFAFLDY